MNNLDPDFMALFSSDAFDSSDELVEAIGLNKLMPGAIIDAKIFEPCGFSLNAIDKVITVSQKPGYPLHSISLQDVYYTIHVTPQVECSWVSFETNSEVQQCLSLIGMVLDTFRPGKAVVSIMATKVRYRAIGHIPLGPTGPSER